VAFLAGPESTWITGQMIGIDGGHQLRRGPDYRSLLGG
jgi:NAD(P)-dependent dehydrogenase (short-subunit alcohol dehydrogenase family)